MTDIARRRLLQILGTAGATALAGCGGAYPGPRRLAALPAGWSRGEERWIASACGQCPAGCGIRVRVCEGHALKIEGDRDHPVSQGGLGPKGQSGLQLLYHSDRIRGPLRREGARGSNRWHPITWDEALKQLAGSLRELRERGAAHELVVVDGEARGVRTALWQRFLEAYGSPNHVAEGWTRHAARCLAMEYACGVHELPAFDWPRTRYVLSFGPNLFESRCQTVHVMRAASEMRRGTPTRRVKLVQVSTRFSRTAAKTDEWIPIEPGTHGALALGIAHVLVRDDLVDAEFLREHTFGFEDWTDEDGCLHRGFRELVLKDYSPESVARVTDVPAETIERIAREMNRNAPAVAVCEGEAEEYSNGLGTVMAVHALNALLGNLERPGGMRVPRPLPLASWAEVEQDAVAREGLSKQRVDGSGSRTCPLGRVNVQALPDAILTGRPEKVSALVFAGANPIFAGPQAGRWQEALERVPLVVSCATLHDETTQWADLVLPDHTYLERREVVEPAPSDGNHLLTLCRPVVDPVHDTLSTGDLVLRLARELGDTIRAALPWPDEQAASMDRLRGVVEATRGSFTTSSVTELLEQLERDGVWWAAVEGAPSFPTPTGKFEFFSRRIAARLAQLFPSEQDLDEYLSAHGVMTRGDDLCLPHWEPPRQTGDPDVLPFLVVPYRGIEFADGRTRRLSLLRELPAAGRWSWCERIELTPEHALYLGVSDGDRVRVESPSGERQLVALVSSTLRPGTVALPLGAATWPPEPGQPSDRSEGLGLLATSAAPLSGLAAPGGTRVRVSKEEA